MRLQKNGDYEMKTIWHLACYASVVASGMLLVNGCATPDPNPGPGPVPIPPDNVRIAECARTFSSKIMPGMLACDEIAGAPGSVVVKVADFKNTTRFFFDSSVFMKNLRLALNRYGQGKVRFLNNNKNVDDGRKKVIKERQEEQVRAYLKRLGAEIAANEQFNRPGNPVKVAVAPVLNTNLVNMNADSFTVMLRSEVVKASKGKIQFLMPGAMEGADYYLTGQFVPESMKKEGLINLSNYIDIIDERIRLGKPLDTASIIAEGSSSSAANLTSSSTVASAQLYEKERVLTQMLHNPAFRANPNVNKHLNVMIVRPSDKVAVYEDMFVLDRKVSDQSGRANLILSGEISGISQKVGGTADDYLLISAQLTDPETNEIVWEDAHEVAFRTKTPIVYQ